MIGRGLMLLLLPLAAADSVLAEDQRLVVQPSAAQPAQAAFEVTVQLVTEDSLVGTLPGVAFRLCWDEPEVQLGNAQPLAAMPPEGDRALGTAASKQACDLAESARGIPMLWLDPAAQWPAQADELLATVAVQVPEGYEGNIRFWVEDARGGPDVVFATEQGTVRFVGDNIFSDRFELTVP